MRFRDGREAGTSTQRGPVTRAIAVLATAGLVATLAGGVATADEPVPSEQQVEDARDAAAAASRDVAAVQADLAVAQQRLERSSVAASRAAEAFNGARYELREARRAARAAAARLERAEGHLSAQQEAYGEALATTYQMAPELTALSAMIEQDGVQGVVEKATTMQHAEAAMAHVYDDYRAGATLAEIARHQATETRDDAARLERESAQAHRAARAAADAAAAEAAAIENERGALIAELARLQGVSTSLALSRQEALEQQAAQAAADAAAAEAAAAAPAAEPTPPPAPEQQPAAPSTPSQPAPTRPANPTPPPSATPSPTPTPTPTPPPAPTPPTPPPTTTPPPAASGAAAAIAYARAQVGKPYRWGASGPAAFDCSGLTMRAWQAGGKSLPHWSVGQYRQSTPISASNLRPGDLVFWGDNSNSSSIYHVALYIGNNQIIHAPRSGRPVVIESMYYWIPPNFFARP